MVQLVPAIFPLSPPKKVKDCKGKGLEQSETQLDQEGKGFKETSGQCIVRWPGQWHHGGGPRCLAPGHQVRGSMEAVHRAEHPFMFFL